MSIFSAYNPTNKAVKMLAYYYTFSVTLLIIGGALSVPTVIVTGFIMLGLTFCVNMMMPAAELTYEQEYGHFPKSRGNSLAQEELSVP